MVAVFASVKLVSNARLDLKSHQDLFAKSFFTKFKFTQHHNISWSDNERYVTWTVLIKVVKFGLGRGLEVWKPLM